MAHNDEDDISMIHIRASQMAGDSEVSLQSGNDQPIRERGAFGEFLDNDGRMKEIILMFLRLKIV